MTHKAPSAIEKVLVVLVAVVKDEECLEKRQACNGGSLDTLKASSAQLAVSGSLLRTPSIGRVRSQLLHQCHNSAPL